MPASVVSVSHTGDTELANIHVPSAAVDENSINRGVVHLNYTNSANDKLIKVRFGA